MTNNVYSYFVTTYNECPAFFERAMSRELLGISDEQDIVIKINMCDLKTPETGAVTHPFFLRHCVKRLKALYPAKQIYIAESDATVVFAEEFFQWLGYKSALRDLNVAFVNLSEEPSTNVPLDGYLFKTLPLPNILRRNYFISMAKLKTNVTSLVTFALKNQYIFVPGIMKSRYHDRIDQAIADANLLRRPDFSIVEGIIGQGGPKAPSFGTPISSHCVVWGKDPVAVDTYCSRLVGINPLFVRHIRLSERKGIGSGKYTQMGDYGAREIDFETSVPGLFFFKYAGQLQRFVQSRQRSVAE